MGCGDGLDGDHEGDETADVRRPMRITRSATAGWMTAHLCWFGSALLTVLAGWRYQDCELGEIVEMGKAGPFMYGEHAGVQNGASLMLLTGAVVALVLTALAVIKSWSPVPTVANLVIGAMAAFGVFMYLVAQVEDPVFCDTGSRVLPAVLFPTLFAAAGVVNLWSRIRPRPTRASTTRTP